MKSEATETAFKENAPHYRVLHLATHGFYSNTRPLVETYSLIDFAFERPVADNPLLHSGLYFAGVNVPPNSIEADTDDGILTALEVSSLALDGTEIVVLSACESGLGDVIEGEGVSGLRRAFHLAGVTTVVSALWSVSDKQTAQLMRNLYSEKNLSMSDQLVKYQRKQLESLRQNRISDHPFYWAPFIAINRR